MDKQAIHFDHCTRWLISWAVYTKLRCHFPLQLHKCTQKKLHNNELCNKCTTIFGVVFCTTTNQIRIPFRLLCRRALCNYFSLHTLLLWEQKDNLGYNWLETKKGVSRERRCYGSEACSGVYPLLSQNSSCHCQEGGWTDVITAKKDNLGHPRKM